MSVRPGSIDDVIAAYQAALRDHRDIEDRLRVVTGVVERLTRERDEKTKLVRELRAEWKNYSGESEVAA